MVDPAKVHPVNRRLDIPGRVDNRSIGAPTLDPRRAFFDIGVPEYSSDDERPRGGPDLRRRIDLVQPAIVHDTDAIPESERLVMIVVTWIAAVPVASSTAGSSPMSRSRR